MRVASKMTIDVAGSGLRSRKYADARRALFDAAMQLFREKGFDETTVDQIAERAAFSRATFFNHFGSKSAVLRFYGEQLEQRVSHMLEPDNSRGSPLERLRQLLLAMLKDAGAHREDLKVIFAYSLRDPAYHAGPTAARQRIIRILAGLIAEAQRRGEARSDMPAQEQATQLLGLYNNALLMIIFGRRNTGTAMDAMWNFALGGLRGRHNLADR